MNKLYRILTIVVIMVIAIVASIFVQVQAFEYTNDGVIKYVTSAHEMNGVTLQLTTTNALSLKGYFLDNPVSDEEAREIIDNLELARKALEDAGVKTTSEVRGIPGLQDKVTDYIEKACDVAGLTLVIDTTKTPLEVGIKHNADNIITQNSYFALFGSNDLDNPDKPVDPDDPNKPVDPDDPSKPVDPDDPSKPVNPDDPNKPVDPDDPNKPVNPDDPNKPVNPSKPDNNNGNNGNSGSNNGSTDTTGSSNTGTVSKTSTAKKLVYTGNDFSLVVRIGVAIVAVAILGIAVKKYAK